MIIVISTVGKGNGDNVRSEAVMYSLSGISGTLFFLTFIGWLVTLGMGK